MFKAINGVSGDFRSVLRVSIGYQDCSRGSRGSQEFLMGIAGRFGGAPRGLSSISRVLNGIQGRPRGVLTSN